MPTTQHAAFIRASSDYGGPDLALKVIHTVDVLSPSIPVSIKTAIPCKLIWHSGQVRLTVTGKHARKQMPYDTIQSSACLQQLLAVLRLNLATLGIEDVSEPSREGEREDQGVETLEFVLRIAGPSDLPVYLRGSPHVTLRSIHIDIAWGTSSKSRDETSDPFATGEVMLPFRRQWETSLQKLLTTHLLRRYPFVFGSWKNDSDAGERYHYAIAQSLCRMILRTHSVPFNKDARGLYKTLQRKVEAASDSAWDSLVRVKSKTDEPIVAEEDLARHRSLTDLTSNSDEDTEDVFQVAISRALHVLEISQLNCRKSNLRIKLSEDGEPMSLDRAVDEIDAADLTANPEDLLFSDEDASTLFQETCAQLGPRDDLQLDSGLLESDLDEDSPATINFVDIFRSGNTGTPLEFDNELLGFGPEAGLHEDQSSMAHDAVMQFDSPASPLSLSDAIDAPLIYSSTGRRQNEDPIPSSPLSISMSEPLLTPTDTTTFDGLDGEDSALAVTTGPVSYFKTSQVDEDRFLLWD